VLTWVSPRQFQTEHVVKESEKNMTHYLIELAIWMLLAYLIGCLLGWALRNLFGAKPVAEPLRVATPVAPAYTPPPAPRPVPVAAPVLKPIPAPTPVAAPVVAAPSVSGKLERPKGIAAARGGKADNLQRISGIGPKNESILHTLGFFHFDQIAAWTAAQVAWVDDHLRFNGRIGREEWIKQAGLLAEGKEAEFTRLYGTGGLRNNKGETLSGSRTRKP
jgi:predicted flap endonuclease-1-like 5' DNA nuclease